MVARWKQIAYTTSNGQPFFYYANRYIAAIRAEGGARGC